MKLLTLLILISFVIWGCSNSSPFLPEKPKNLLSKEKFKVIFSEMTLNEMMVQTKISSPIKINKESNRLAKMTLKKHGVDSLQYVQSFDYYAADKDEMEKIHTEIIEDFKIKKAK